MATRVAPNALISGHTCCRAASSAFAVESPFASVETYCDRPLFEHHTYTHELSVMVWQAEVGALATQTRQVVMGSAGRGG
jgi:hypothetical protein